MSRGGDARVDLRTLSRGGDGRPERVDPRTLSLGGTARVDTRNLISGGDGRCDVKPTPDQEHCGLRSFWWQYASDCALLASVCFSHEASCHTFWTHEEWMYNLLLHTTDEHFVKVASAYKKFCIRRASKGICGVCGVTGLPNGGKKISLKDLRYFICRGDEYDDSLYGKFQGQLRNAQNKREAAIAQLRLDTLHTYTHPDGVVYHIFEKGVLGDKYCSVCATCHTTVSVVNPIYRFDVYDNIILL